MEEEVDLGVRDELEENEEWDFSDVEFEDECEVEACLNLPDLNPPDLRDWFDWFCCFGFVISVWLSDELLIP